MKSATRSGIGMSESALDTILLFGRRIPRNPDMRATLREALKVLRKLTAAEELRVVHTSESGWKEWHAAGRKIREYDQIEWPPPSPSALTAALDHGTGQYGFVSISPASGDAKRTLEMVAAHIASAVTIRAAIRRVRAISKSETEMAREAMHVRDEERQRITRELHDDLGQTIATLKLKLKSVEDRLRADEVEDAVVEELRDARNGVGDLLSRVRRISHTLYPHILDVLGLAPAIEELAGQVSNPPALKARCTVRGRPRPIRKDQSLALYRCCQEALNNAIRHSGASRIEVDLVYTDGDVRIVVDDDGRGFDPHKLYGANGRLMSSGFWTIRQRVNAVGGAFSVGTSEGTGTSIEIIIPIETETER